MSTWAIKYRGGTGVMNMEVLASNQEEAEAAFYEFLLENEEFGAILRIEPAIPA